VAAVIAVKVHRGTTELQFAGDDKPGRYNGRLEDWSAFYMPDGDCESPDEDEWSRFEVHVGVRQAPKKRKPKRVNPSGGGPSGVSTECEPKMSWINGRATVLMTRKVNPMRMRPIKMVLWGCGVSC
jgi:hypothetical protein